MKVALITTTIFVPHVLALYRKYGPDVAFFVAQDTKTPDCHKFANEITNCEFFYGQEWKCSELIGWNCIQRRNIALLEALKWGAEIIVSVDDDNIPLHEDYFDDFFKHWWFAVDTTVAVDRKSVSVKTTPQFQPFNGLLASSPTGWFDVGQLLQPISPHRGMPHDKVAQPFFSHVVGVPVGVAAGICLGDPDISAVTRMAVGPTVHGVSEVLRSGVVTDPRKTWTVYNTQNTSFIRKLAPAMFCPPGIGRYDDIVASLVTQRVMREQGYHVHFGKPFVWQQRNQHDLTKDLSAELWGMLNIKNVAERLDNISLPQTDSVAEQVRVLYEALGGTHWFPTQAAEAALAFCDDCASVM